MLRALLFCTLGAAVLISEQATAENSIDFTVPEPRVPHCVLRVQVLPLSGVEWIPAQEQEFLRRLAERVRLLMPGAVTPRLVRKNGQVYLHLYGDSAGMPAAEIAVKLQYSLNRRSGTYFLAVHPRQSELLQRADIISLLARYELDMEVWLEGSRSTPPPHLPRLPEVGDTAGYVLAEQAVADACGIIRYNYYIVRSPELAGSEGVLVTNEDTECAEVVEADITQKQDGVRICLNPRAVPRMHRLTLPLARSGGQLALVSDGAVLAAASVPAPLSREFILTAADGRDMVYALLPPLPGEVKLEVIDNQGSR